MPKQRITREMILDAAFAIFREGGESQVLVRNIAERLGCSAQPIYSYCNNMEQLRNDLYDMARRYFKQYLMERMDRRNPFRSMGLAHVSFAKEESELFRFLFLQERHRIKSYDDFYDAEIDPNITKQLGMSLGLDERKAREFHMNVLTYTFGVSLLASTGAQFSDAEVSERLEQAYHAFLEQIRRNQDEKG